MSIEAVATRVGIAKTTVYRRYPTKLDLVRAAIRQFLDEAIGEPPDTGSLRGDLIALGRQAVLLGSSVIGQSLLRTNILDRVPELERMGQDLEAEREERYKVVGARAVARGELADESDLTRVCEVLSGSLLLRLVIKKVLVDELEIGRIVDLLLHGVTPGAARLRSKSHGLGPVGSAG